MSDHNLKSLDELKRIVPQLRIEIVKMIKAAGSRHPGGYINSSHLI